MESAGQQKFSLIPALINTTSECSDASHGFIFYTACSQFTPRLTLGYGGPEGQEGIHKTTKISENKISQYFIR